MKHTTLSLPVESRLSSYQRQARLYTNHSRFQKKTSIKKNTLMALVPLVAFSMPSMAQSCTVTNCVYSFSQTFAIAGTAGTFSVNLPHNGGGTDFRVLYSNTSSGFKGLVPIALGTNAREVIPFNASANVVPRLDPGDSIQTNRFVATSGSVAIYSGSSGSFVASPATPLTYPVYIAIRSGGHYGFLSISIVGGVATIKGGINENTVIGDSAPVEAGSCCSLPVELVSFQAEAEASAITLNWNTATEIENSGFEVQRGTNIHDFQKIAWIEGNGTTADESVYAYKDEKVVANELYYYRLLQVDHDGSTSFSEIITAKIEGKEEDVIGNIYPNPVQDQAVLPIRLVEAREATLSLFDNQGKLIKNRTEYLNKGTNEVLIDMQSLISGNYFIKLQLESEVIYRKVIKI